MRIIKILAILILLSCRSNDTDTPVFESDVSTPVLDSVEIITGVVEKGETLSGIIRENGFSAQAAYDVSSQLQKIYDLKYLKAGDRYRIEADSMNSLLKLSLMPSREKEYIVTADSAGHYTATVRAIPLTKRIESMHGRIETTLYDAVLAKGGSPELLIAFSDIFQWDIDFFIDPREEDPFRIVYEAYYLPIDSFTMDAENAKLARYGAILAAQYKDLTAVYYKDRAKNSGYYAPDGTSFQKTFLKSPLNYRRISSYFSKARRHPILKIVRPHTGVDFAAPMGTPVSATGDGVIIKKGNNRSIGNYVRIRHQGTRFETLYGHLSRFARGIRKGTRVKQKQTIGYVGKTGLATGPHLHYTVYENGKPINPLKIKSTTGDPITEKQRDDFERVKRRMLSLLYNMEGTE